MNSAPVNVSPPSGPAAGSPAVGTGVVLGKGQDADFLMVLTSQLTDEEGAGEGKGEAQGADLLLNQLLFMGGDWMGGPKDQAVPSSPAVSGEPDAAVVEGSSGVAAAAVHAIGLDDPGEVGAIADVSLGNTPSGMDQGATRKTGPTPVVDQAHVPGTGSGADGIQGEDADASSQPRSMESTQPLQGAVQKQASPQRDGIPQPQIQATSEQEQAMGSKGLLPKAAARENTPEGVQQAIPAGKTESSGQSAGEEKPFSESPGEPVKTGQSAKETGVDLKIAFPEPMQKAAAQRAPQPAENRPLREQILHRLVDQVRMMESPSAKEVTIQLKPDFLGKLNLQITLEDGVVSAKFLAESQQVKGLIEGSLPQLRQSLQDMGIKLDRLEVGVGQGPAGGFQHEFQQSSQEAMKERYEQMQNGQGKGDGGYDRMEGVYGNAREQGRPAASVYRSPESSVEFIA